MLGNTSGWMVSLGDKLGDDFKPEGINNRFDIVGNGASGGLVYNAWSKTITYMGNALGTFSNVASVINQNGMVAGLVGGKGYLYSEGSVVYFGAHISSINGINAQGDVVGLSLRSSDRHWSAGAVTLRAALRRRRAPFVTYPRSRIRCSGHRVAGSE